MASTNELAEDYKASLEDLTFNSRYEIGNLTVIARENIQSAQAIARTLETHIHQTAPVRKLPALYLLDSIAKNVGTPYTLFFQRNLYQTFMDAYLVVEPPVRRKLEEMLQTWKQPVPGSTSAQPVFSSEMTRKIDNALIKARTAALQHQQKMRQTQESLGMNGRVGRTPPPQHMKNTPPPNGAHQYSNGQGFDYGRNGAGTPVARNGNTVGGESSHRIYLRPYSHTMLQPVMNSSTPVGLHLPISQAMPSLSTMAPLGGSVDTLHSDINHLLESSQAAFAKDPTNQGIVERVQALLDLQRILQTQQLPQEQLAIVREQVRALANPTPPPQIVAPPPPPPPPPQPLQIPFSTQDLAALLATATQGAPMTMPSQTTPVSMPALLPPIPPPAAQAQVPQNQGSDASSLFASLQKAGLIPGMNLPLPPPPLPPGAPLLFPVPGSLPQSLVGNIPGHIMTSGPNRGSNWRNIDVEMKSASLKIPRPHLIALLDETLPSKCSSCARRFENSEKGKKEKAAHLDWHFRVHLRMNESLKTGQTRSWYVDEEDWIHYREDDEDTATAHARNPTTDLSLTTPQATVEELKKQYVVVPDPSESHKVCPICQEELHYVWHAETDEFVWMDAKQVGSRVYHASCHAEASKDKASGGIGSREGTPSNSLGSKRKAEDDDLNPKVKIQKDPMS